MTKYLIYQIIIVLVFILSVILIFIKADSLVWKVLSTVFSIAFMIFCLVHINRDRDDAKTQKLIRCIVNNDIEEARKLFTTRQNINNYMYSKVTSKKFTFEEMLSPF